MGLRRLPSFTPPAYLRIRVHGSDDLASFHYVGKVIAFNLERAIRLERIRIPKRSRILDFGCGCGRVLYWLRRFYPSVTFYGTDTDEEALSWCQDHLSSRGHFVGNGAAPPLPFEEQFFDLVYSISVFTHLSEALQFCWLEELKRVTKPGSYLLLSVHGGEFFDEAPREFKEHFREAGFYSRSTTDEKGCREPFETSYHAEQYIRARWGEIFEVEEIIKGGINNDQDLVLCRRLPL